jgi:HAE1 family hydrophobic/amphiphilic exporter-1
VASLLASLAVAMLLIPALARWFLPQDGGSGPTVAAVPRYRRATERAVRAALRRPAVTVAAAAVAAGASGWMLLTLGTELLAPSDPRQFSVRVVGPSGQRVESTSRVVEGIESLLAQASGGELRAVLSEVGRLPDDDRTVRTELTEENTARLTVRMGSGGPAAGQLAVSVASALEALESTEVSWEVGSSALASALGTSGPPIVVEVSGQSLPDLRRGADIVRERLARLSELWNVRSSFEGGPPELRVELDRAMADGLSVDLDTLSRVLQTTLDGRDVTMLSLGDEERPVTLRLPTPRREELASVVFRNQQGRQIAVREVARFVEAEGAREIFRRDQRRTAEVTARLADGVDNPRAVAAVTAALSQAPLPPGLRAQLRGEEEERIRTFGELQLAAALAMVLVFMVLAATFESLLHPLTVLAAIPLALVGVAVALVPAGQPIGMMAMLGLIVLAGIAVNDAVLLLDAARQLMAAGVDRTEALVQAAGTRLRPIVMTTLTTVLALLPLAFGTGEGAEIRSPMAVTIIGGLLASTVASLLVLPSLYLLLDMLRPGGRSGAPA